MEHITEPLQGVKYMCSTKNFVVKRWKCADLMGTEKWCSEVNSTCKENEEQLWQQ